MNNDKGFIFNNSILLEEMFKITTSGSSTDNETTICGQIVTVKYKLTTIDNQLIEEKKETYPLGSKKNIPGFDAIIVGMKKGQKRKAIIP